MLIERCDVLLRAPESSGTVVGLTQSHHSTTELFSMRVAHIITRLVIGGAQENTILNCQDLARDHGDEVCSITGPGLGPEGSLEDDARARGIRIEVLPMLRRNIHPWRDAAAYRAIGRAIREFRPDVVHTHSGKAGLFGRVAAWRLQVPAIIHTVHGAPFHQYQGRGARAFFAAAKSSPPRVATPSSASPTP